MSDEKRTGACPHGLLRRTCGHCDALEEVRELTAKLAAAEAELGKAAEAFMRYANGDIVIRWNPDGFYGYGRGIQGNACGPHASAFDAALAALAALPQEQA